jgi:tRNA(Arg) A34 adenosine deaminase TadA
MNHEHWMDLAIELARAAEPTGNTPVASVIVRDGTELGRGINEVTTKLDPILHAETVAIQDACRRLGTNKLTGATLYSIMESCPMCAWAIHAAGIDHVVLGARHVDLRRTDMGDYSMEKLAVMTKQKLTVTDDVRRLECVALRRDWSQRTGRVV